MHEYWFAYRSEALACILISLKRVCTVQGRASGPRRGIVLLGGPRQNEATERLLRETPGLPLRFSRDRAAFRLGPHCFGAPGTGVLAYGVHPAGFAFVIVAGTDAAGA
jgi:hypothetical protein